MYAATAAISLCERTFLQAGIELPGTPSRAIAAIRARVSRARSAGSVKFAGCGSRKLPIQLRPVPSAAWQNAQFA